MPYQKLFTKFIFIKILSFIKQIDWARKENMWPERTFSTSYVEHTYQTTSIRLLFLRFFDGVVLPFDKHAY